MATDLSFSIEINGIQKTITSTAEASKVIKDLTKNFVELSKAGKDVSQTLLQIGQANKIKDSLVQVSRGAVQMKEGMQGAQTASANASMALLNLNYVIRDSPYFFNNFALGVLAVGNNINPLIDSFNRLRTEAVGKSISTFQLLKQALVGGAGISIAFSLVVTAIQSFVFWQASAKSKTEETTKAVSDLVTALNQVANVRMPSTISKYNISPEQLPFVIMGLDKKIASMQGTQKAITTAPQTIGEGETRTRLELEGINKEVDKTLGSHKEILGELMKEKAQLQAQYDVYKIMGDLGLKDEKTQKEKTKQLKEQAIIIHNIATDISDRVRNRQAGNLDAVSGILLGEQRNRPSLFTNTRRSNSAENNKAFQIGGGMKDLGIDLELGKIAAQELGNALASAFDQGKVKLSEFIKALGIAIAKMLLLKFITGLLTGGIGGGASAVAGIPSMPSTGNPNLGKSNYGSTVNVQGKISVNKNKFVIDIENAKDSYNNSGKLVTIGRD